MKTYATADSVFASVGVGSIVALVSVFSLRFHISEARCPATVQTLN